MKWLALFSLVVLGSACDSGPFAGFYESCSESPDCFDNATCYTVAWEEGRNGTMCSDACEVDADCPTAPGVEASCFELLGGPPGAGKTCYQSCTFETDCALGFTCVDAERDGLVVGSICVPQ